MSEPATNRLAAQTSHTLRLGANVGRHDEFVFHTDPALLSPDDFRTAELLLLEVTHDASPERLLVVDANYGAVGVVMASFETRVTMTETSARAAACARGNAKRNNVAETTRVELTDTPRDLAGSFDVSVLAARPYEPAVVVEQRMANALATVAPGGRFYLAAKPETGLHRYERTLKEICDQVSRVRKREGCVVLEAIRPPRFLPPTFARTSVFRETIDGVSATLTSYPGLFSATQLDAGTRVLAEQVVVEDGEDILDLACGYGPLGVYAALTAECTVMMTDDNCIATACARASAVQSGVQDRVEVVTADCVEGVRDLTFDRIVCNPPTHAGSAVLHELMRGAGDVLAGDGILHLVHHREIAFDTFVDPYVEVDESVICGDYRVLTCRRG